ncbi:cysteine proteinase [Dendrothele bispora CBS 962.96]|uniref:Cysteine proteinase n=1 Tax=Dendrothele bispora (strain CBS 962.96) TaxID=1314807 RepID=A0A4S8M426_DENBC|nr:cysteine proteinase [Dendrothele bispora CBS 962.96]
MLTATSSTFAQLHSIQGVTTQVKAILSALAKVVPGYTLTEAQKMSSSETNYLFSDTLSSIASPETPLSIESYKKLIRLHHSILLGLEQLAQLPILPSALKDLSRQRCPGDTSLHHVIKNLYEIQQLLGNECERLNSIIWELPEKSPVIATQILNSLVAEASGQNFKFIQHSDLQTLSPERWLNGETINYFVDKWCTDSDTLGVSTYWANTFLFKDKACTKPLDHFDNNSKIVKDLKRSIRKRELDLNTLRWSKVYIPINNAEEGHWYCACINFDRRTIDILDSWGPTYRSSLNRPLRQKKHTSLLAALMWITEQVADYRGENVVLARNPDTDWSCNPHVEVPLQPNSYDCGIHTLWHLYHIINFGGLKNESVLPAQHRFTENMVGKRLRLVQEILDDAGFRL